MITTKMNTSQRQEFCVRWNSHLGSIGAAFPQLLAGQRFVDVTLACEGHQVHCHRLVLAACSSYFESILAENPCKHPVIILPSEIKLWEIQALVDFMYKGEVNVTQAGLPQLLHCAEQLRIRGLYGSDAALNLNQLKALTTKAAAFTMPVVSGTTNVPCSAGMGGGGATNDSTETDDTAGTNSTVTTTTATAASALQQLQAGAVIGQLVKDERYSLQQTNGGTGQVQPELQQSIHLSTINANATNTSNAATEDESADDSTSNAYDQYEDYAAGGNVAVATVKSAKAGNNNSALMHLDSTVEEDHNYVAHDEDSYEQSTGMDTEHETSGNSSLLQASLDASGSLKRVRRSEASLAQAAKCVSKGQTFQTVSNLFNIPVSTIRFYMARKGILPKRKRGRGASTAAGITPMLPSAMMSQAIAQMKRSGSVSPTSLLETTPAYHLVGGNTNVSTGGGGVVAYKLNEKSTANVM